jgi:hypothetical protein
VCGSACEMVMVYEMDSVYVKECDWVYDSGSAYGSVMACETVCETACVTLNTGLQ